MPYKKRNKIVDELSVPRNKYLGNYPLDSSDDSLLIAICAEIFQDEVQKRYGNLSKDQLTKAYMELADEVFIFPEKDEFYLEDKLLSQGVVKNQAQIDKKNEKIHNILQKFKYVKINLLSHLT